MRRPPAENPDSRLGPLSRSASRRLAAWLLLAGMLVAFDPMGVRGQDERPTTAAEARQQRNELREQKAQAAAELDAARAADADVAAALAGITDAVNAKQLELDEAQRQLDAAAAVAAEAEAQIAAADAERAALVSRIGDYAVNGFLEASNPDLGNSVLSSANPNEALRRSALLRIADSDSDDLLEQLRTVREDRALAEESALAAVEAALRLKEGMAGLVAELEAQRQVQADLKAELEARVSAWETEMQGLAAEEQELSDFIREQEARVAPRAGSPAVPGVTSSSGFIWPVNASVTSEFGYRVHPIFGTRRLHAGIDLGAGSGTEIMATKGGTVLSAGPYGGYGNAVVIAHGDGLSSLYAHQSKIAVSAGETVDRGEVIGYVGSTGQSTGPHLHFEIRESGDPVNPRRYLP